MVFARQFSNLDEITLNFFLTCNYIGLYYKNAFGIDFKLQEEHAIDIDDDDDDADADDDDDNDDYDLPSSFKRISTQSAPGGGGG